MRVLASLAGLAWLAAAPLAQERSGLQNLLDAELARFPARAGVWVKHLTTGQEAGVHADDTFNSASVIKIPVLVLAFQLAEQGRPSLSERITIRADVMIRMMRAQQAGARRLPHFLTVPVAHKTGDFPPVLANDVGVVFARSGPIVISFFTNAIEGPYAETEDRIGQVARLIVEYFDGR